MANYSTDMTRKELLALADELGVELEGKLNKSEIVAALDKVTKDPYADWSDDRLWGELTGTNSLRVKIYDITEYEAVVFIVGAPSKEFRARKSVAGTARRAVMEEALAWIRGR